MKSHHCAWFKPCYTLPLASLICVPPLRSNIFHFTPILGTWHLIQIAQLFRNGIPVDGYKIKVTGYEKFSLIWTGYHQIHSRNCSNSLHWRSQIYIEQLNCHCLHPFGNFQSIVASRSSVVFLLHINSKIDTWKSIFLVAVLVNITTGAILCKVPADKQTRFGKDYGSQSTSDPHAAIKPISISISIVS